MEGKIIVTFTGKGATKEYKGGGALSRHINVYDKVMSYNISSEIHAPNEFIYSCYGGNGWNNELPYLNNNAWKNY